MYRLPVRVADAISRRARRANLGDLSQFGLPIPEEGVFSRVKRLEQVPGLVDVDVIDAIRNGSIEVVATVESFDRDKVVLVDGSRLDAHAVVLATGYRRGLAPLWWVTSACSMQGVNRSSRANGPPRTGCGSSATTPGRP